MADLWGSISWQQAETRAVEHLRSLGFQDARRSPGGTDGGIDVHGTGVVAQVKDWARPVGEPPVRDLYGTALALQAEALFYSSSGFTRQATEWANRNGVALFQFHLDGPVPLNQAAHQLVLRTGRSSTGRRLGIFAQQRVGAVDRLLPDVRKALEAKTQRATVQAATGSTHKRRKAEAALVALRDYRRQLARIEALDPTTKGLEKALRNLQGYIKQIRL